MLLKSIEIKKDKNLDEYKCLTLGDGRKIFYVGQKHSRYNELEAGTDVNESELEQDGKWWKLKDSKQSTSSGSKNQTQDIIRKDVETAQDRTSESVRMNGAATDATNYVIAFYPELATVINRDDKLKELWEQWRKYFYEKRSEPFV